MSENNNNQPPFNDYLGFGKNEDALKKAMDIGEKYHNDGNYASAIKHFDYVIINDFENKFMFSYIYKALAYYALKEFNFSIGICTEAINIGKKIYEIKAEEKVKKIMAILHEVRSRSYIETNQKQEAIKDLRNSIEYFPTDAHGRLAYLLFEEKKYSEAINYYQNMAMLFPDNGYNRFMMGICYLNLNDKENAKSQFAISNNQGYEKAYEYFAKLSF